MAATPRLQSATQVHETRIGVVLMQGERACTLKKPADIGFADFASSSRTRGA